MASRRLVGGKNPVAFIKETCSTSDKDSCAGVGDIVEGDQVGLCEGREVVGLVDGELVVGEREGVLDGDDEGRDVVGDTEGRAVGRWVGDSDVGDSEVGYRVGESVGGGCKQKHEPNAFFVTSE